MTVQQQINPGMRSILVDWLVDVGVHFEVMNETLHMAIHYTDMALSKLNIQKSQLQLVGTSCMKIADIFNEKSKEYYRQENAVEYAYITADEYTPQNVIAMEKEILSLLSFDLCVPTPIHFIKLYARVLKLDPLTELIACYIADI
jgi:cyclin A